MFTANPFFELAGLVPPVVMKMYVIAMIVLVVGGTLLDVIHKQSAKYFFKNAQNARKAASRSLSGGEKASIALQTLAEEVLTSAEFCSPRRRASHLLTMYGFIIFIVTSAVMIFAYTDSPAPTILPLLWHAGALMLCIGGYWFWFFIRVDVAAEGHPWYRVMRADLFILSLLATATFALIWSALQAAGAAGWSTAFFALFVLASMALFGTVPWSKFAHMFFKPAAAYQKKVAQADGSRDGLPAPADQPAQYGPGIKRLLPRNY